ncbi:hypothetical protein CB1_000053002 [Camelus ferus]|nr:hypothetical protein CB1_000053002 [Camelus ferus]
MRHGGRGPLAELRTYRQGREAGLIEGLSMKFQSCPFFSCIKYLAVDAEIRAGPDFNASCRIPGCSLAFGSGAARAKAEGRLSWEKASPHDQGPELPKPEVISQLEQGAELWVAERELAQGCCPGWEPGPEGRAPPREQGLPDEKGEEGLLMEAPCPTTPGEDAGCEGQVPEVPETDQGHLRQLEFSLKEGPVRDGSHESIRLGEDCVHQRKHVGERLVFEQMPALTKPEWPEPLAPGRRRQQPRGRSPHLSRHPLAPSGENPGGGMKAGQPAGRALALFDIHEIMQEKNPVHVIGVEEPPVGTSVLFDIREST